MGPGPPVGGCTRRRPLPLAPLPGKPDQTFSTCAQFVWSGSCSWSCDLPTWITLPATSSGHNQPRTGMSLNIECVSGRSLIHRTATHAQPSPGSELSFRCAWTLSSRGAAAAGRILAVVVGYARVCMAAHLSNFSLPAISGRVVLCAVAAALRSPPRFRLLTSGNGENETSIAIVEPGHAAVENLSTDSDETSIAARARPPPGPCVRW